jgi:NADPH:quinone reductase-like Zn-dependent oxidoreductase
MQRSKPTGQFVPIVCDGQSPYRLARLQQFIVSLFQSGAIKPIVAKTFPLAEAADALR